MCGIIGITGSKNVSDNLVAGLQRLEYRGYDSAGIAVFDGNEISRRRAPGKLRNLRGILTDNPLDGLSGIAHTRWATHGEPTEDNAHPHAAGGVFVVHNGIIENHSELKEKLNRGSNSLKFESDTDTEVIAHLFDNYLQQGLSGKEAFHKTLQDLDGAYAIVAMVKDAPEVLYCARLGSPMVVGYGSGETFVGSDTLALAGLTNQLTYLEEGDWAILTPADVAIYDSDARPVERKIIESQTQLVETSKDGHSHYMYKEILEQPDAVARSLLPYINKESNSILVSKEVSSLFANTDRGVGVACGSAHYVCKTAQYWFERLAKFHMTNEIASEFRYRGPVWPSSGPGIFVSQSGETADTLKAVKYCVENDVPTLAIVNVLESSIARAASQVHYTEAGPEIGVASTKAFTAQLAVMLITALQAAKARGKLSEREEEDAVEALVKLPDQIRQTLMLTDAAQLVAKELANHRAAIFVGRGQFAPIAEEGALKLKEIAYLYASAYPAGELKHGPIALIEKGLPVIAIAPMDELFHKTLSNLQEVKARGAAVTLITDVAGQKEAQGIPDNYLIIPKSIHFTAPILATIPLQFLAYYTALEKGTDVDMPRNLAKSVTVE